jgi:hypothetical protein
MIIAFVKYGIIKPVLALLWSKLSATAWLMLPNDKYLLLLKLHIITTA